MSKKKIWLSVTALILVAAAIAACVLVPRMPKEEVFVYSYDMVGYVNYYSGGRESYGMVTTDKVQSVFLTDTQSVTDVKVYQGQTVRKGQVLYNYDTTLTDLELERKELSIQQLEQSLKTAQAELNRLKKLKPMVLPNEPDKDDKDKTEPGKSPNDNDLVGEILDGTGSSYDPFRVWLKKTTNVSEDMIYDYLKAKDEKMEDAVYVVFGVVNAKNREYDFEYGVRYNLAKVKTAAAEPVAAAETPAAGSGRAYSEASDLPSQDDPETEPTTAPTEESTEPTEESTEPTEESTEPTEESTEPTEESTEPTEESTVPSEPPAEQTELVIQMRFFQPDSSASEDDKDIIWNSGYTSSELTAMKAEQNDKISTLKFDIKVAKAEYAIMKKEADKGEVVAEFDGTVVSVMEPEEAIDSNMPMIKVAGGGGFYVEGSVSELDLATIQVGQTVDVTSWDTYTTYQGTITEIGAYPTEEENYYYGSANVSYYPYKVFIDESADLQEGYYVSMTYQTTSQEGGTMYLENAFLRTENGVSYVYVRNEEGLLEKRVVETGDSSDGYMTQILSGLSETDYIAFPYGKDIVEGAPTVEGAWEDLYGY